MGDGAVGAADQSRPFIAPLRHPGMDEGTARRLFDVTAARVGLLGKSIWTEEEGERFEAELRKMPGEFRSHMHWYWSTTDEDNRKLAKSYGMDVETFLRLTFAGNDVFMRHTHHSESDPPEGYTADIPGNTFGVGIPDVEVTPS